MKKASFTIDGMSCQACAARIEKVLSKKESIICAEVNFAGERASVDFDETKTSLEQIVSWINATGFQAAVITDQTQSSQKTHTPIPWTALPAWLALIPFLIDRYGNWQAFFNDACRIAICVSKHNAVCVWFCVL